MSTSPKRLYLDQNKWIELSRAHYGRSDGAHLSHVYEKISRGVEDGSLILPLSSSHYVETRKSRNMDRRKRLARVMVALSKGWTITTQACMTRKLIALEVDSIFGGAPRTVSPDPFGHGWVFAFGRSDELSNDLGIEVHRAKLLEQAMDTPEVFYQLLVGDDEDANSMAIDGYERGAAELVGRIEANRILGHPYGKAIRKWAYVANLTLSLESVLSRALAKHALTFHDFLSTGRDKLLSFFASIPCLDVEIELATERNEFRDRAVASNDMTDIAFLSMAVPYCDIVVTERLWADLVRRKHLDRKYATTTVSDLSLLSGVL